VRPLAIAVALLASLAASPHAVRADTPPGTWDLAKDPTERDRWALHVRVERLLHPPLSDEVLPLDRRRDEELRLEAARAMLEEAGAERSGDARLRFDLGVIYERLATLLARDDLHRRAVDILAPALDAAPDHPAATVALDALVYAYAKLDRPDDELATWRRYISRLSDDRARAGPMMNMGEAEMRLGRLDEAIGTFRNVLQICLTLSNTGARNSTYALTLWDLAVALDRAGDFRTAIDTAAQAKELRWREAASLGQVREVTGWTVIRDQESVFFVPDWEREWYLALGYAAAARDERDVRAIAALWAAAEEHWGVYVTRATAVRTDDRWLAIARLRLDHAHAERNNAEKRAATLPPRAREDEPTHGEHRL
jgi:tetratricopeptide (TPR) repeat protein